MFYFQRLLFNLFVFKLDKLCWNCLSVCVVRTPVRLFNILRLNSYGKNKFLSLMPSRGVNITNSCQRERRVTLAINACTRNQKNIIWEHCCTFLSAVEFYITGKEDRSQQWCNILWPTTLVSRDFVSVIHWFQSLWGVSSLSIRVTSYIRRGFTYGNSVSQTVFYLCLRPQ